MLEVSSTVLWETVKHTFRWIINLKNAKIKRKKESIDALRAVILAVRKTSTYLRQIKDTGNKSYDKETELAYLWTELSFSLHDVGLFALAEKCNLKGKHWSDPDNFDMHLVNKTDISLEKIENLANSIINDIV